MEMVLRKSFLQKLLLTDQSIPDLVETIFKQKPQLNILSEEKTSDHFLRVLTLDVTRRFGFSPVAYCLVRILDFDHVKNIDEYHLVDKGCGSCLVKVESLLDNKDFPEVKKYLKAPYHGRKVNLICEGMVVAELIEFLSAKPNDLAAKSVLDYLAKNKWVKNTKRRLQELLDHCHAAFDCKKEEAMEVVFSEFPDVLKQIISEETVEIDHFAFMIAPGMNTLEIDAILNENGFEDNHRQFSSTVMAKELGKKLNCDEVETNIIKATLTNGYREIEIFVPNDASNVYNWIESGMGSHIAFRVKSEKSIYLILDALNKNHIPIPSFMLGKPLRNSMEGCTVLYCELKSGLHPFRIEFIHKDRG